MQVKNIAECILQYFRPSLSYHLSLKSLFHLFLSGSFTQVLLYRKFSEFLLPYKPRPETSAVAARRLVAGALGLQSKIQSKIPKEKRDKERQQLKEAKGGYSSRFVKYSKRFSI